MITRINKYVWMLFVVCCTLSATAVSAASDAEYKKIAKTWTLNSDGSQQFRCVKELTIFTHAAMNGKYGESFIEYNPQYQTLQINESYTRQRNGNLVKTPANAFVEVLPKNAEDAPAYNHLKEMVVVHTGLELGATIYLDYTITSKPGYLPEIDVFEPIQRLSPIREYTLTTITPTNKNLSYTLANVSARPVVKEEAGKRTTSWTLHNVPQLAPSVGVDVANGDLPYLAATTYADRQAALQFLNQQMSSVSQTEAGQIKTLVDELTKDAKCDRCKIKNISAFVSTHLATSAVTLGETGYRFRSAADVLASAYGTGIEKAHLMALMLKAAGLDAEVVAGYPLTIEKGAALAAVSRFYINVPEHHCILSIQSLQRPQAVIFGQSPVYRISDGAQVMVETPEKYQITGQQHVSVADGKWNIHNQETVGSALLPYFTASQVDKDNEIPLRVRHGYATLVLQESTSGISSMGFDRLNSRRKVNILLPRRVDETYTYEITCPANMQLRTPVSKHEIQNAAGTVLLSVETKNHNVLVTRSIRLNKQLYTAGEYKDLRTLLTTWSEISGKTLLFAVESGQ